MLTSPRSGLPGRPPAPVAALTSTDLSRELGARGTFVQFSSATCATCPQVRRVLTELVATQPGVVHVDIQASTLGADFTRVGDVHWMARQSPSNGAT
ncbi:MAG TPA: hypothetical protein VFE92_10400 [Dermatophilaceae bacterium]|nr:hypothetical protein [Dermatophilaceae bacterium]